jgi:CheY-like chemotaxis protein
MTKKELTRKTILVIDDDDSIKEALEDLLTNEGYVVVTASNGNEGLSRMREVKPHLILLDMRMPVMDGWEFKKEKDADPKFDSIPVLVFSAFSTPPPGISAQGVIPKPLSGQIVLNTIQDCLRSREE